MGCDIHMHTEIKVNDKWEHYGNPTIDRDYNLFAFLANVRNYDHAPFISEPKGIPDDLSLVTQLCCDHMGSDGHSHSYLNSEEILLLYSYLQDRGLYPESLLGYCFGNGWDIKLFPDEVPDYIQDVRLVFWFDS